MAGQEQQLKILQLVTQRQYRGAEIAAATLTAQLTEKGHEVVFAGLYKTKGDALTAKGAAATDIANFSHSKFSFIVLYKLLRFVIRYNPDIIQANGSDTIKYAAVVKMLRPHLKLVYRNISILSIWLGNSWIKLWFYRFLFRHVDHVTSVGYEAANDIGKTLRIPRSKITVIRRSVFSTAIDKKAAAAFIKHKYQWNETDSILFAAGSFSAEKNFLFLVDVMEHVCKQANNIRLIIAGNGPEFELVQKRIAAKGLQDFILLTGFESDLSTYYAAADVFVMCSTVEGVPGVILEAGLAGTPTIANDTGGVKEVIKNGETGILLPTLAIDNYVNTILKFIHDPVLKTQLGEGARQFVTTEFDPEKNLNAYLALYHALVFEKKQHIAINDERIKILQLIQKFQLRGAENFAAQLSSHLEKNQHEVLIVGLTGEAKNAKNGFSLHANLKFRFFDIIGWHRLYRMIKQHHVQIVQANAADTLKYAVMSKLIFRWDCPIVYRNASMMSHYLKGKSAFIFNRFLLGQVDHIIAVSETSLHDISDTFNINKQKCNVIPSGIEEQRFSKLDVFEEGSFHLVMVAGYTFEKNHKGMLSIFEKVVAQLPHARLWLVGDGPLRKEIETLVRVKQLEERVVFTGNVNNPLDYIHSANVLVVPSVLEGLPAVILEAFYVQTPVVAFDVGGIREAVRPETGWLIDAGNEEQFASCLIELSQLSTGTVQAKTQQAHALVCKSYLNPVLAHQFETVYKNVLQSAAA